jgi:hypothetical protein
VPKQLKLSVITALERDMVLPQLSVTTGGVGSVALAIQEAVAVPLAGMITVGAATVYVNVHG